MRACRDYGDMPMAADHPGAWSPALADAGMSEDCLYLNIWTPARTAEDSLPVLVFFHGGSMQSGFSYAPAFDGEHLALRGIIVVTVGYRVGLFGFLAHPELTALLKGREPVTNCGVQDQSAARHWVHRNIRAFGGDPS